MTAVVADQLKQLDALWLETGEDDRLAFLDKVRREYLSRRRPDVDVPNTPRWKRPKRGE